MLPIGLMTIGTTHLRRSLLLLRAERPSSGLPMSHIAPNCPAPSPPRPGSGWTTTPGSPLSLAQKLLEVLGLAEVLVDRGEALYAMVLGDWNTETKRERILPIWQNS